VPQAAATTAAALALAMIAAAVCLRSQAMAAAVAEVAVWMAVAAVRTGAVRLETDAAPQVVPLTAVAVNGPAEMSLRFRFRAVSQTVPLAAAVKAEAAQQR
jgi:uncharacterized membrane-anchored protein